MSLFEPVCSILRLTTRMYDDEGENTSVWWRGWEHVCTVYTQQLCKIIQINLLQNQIVIQCWSPFWIRLIPDTFWTKAGRLPLFYSVSPIANVTDEVKEKNEIKIV